MSLSQLSAKDIYRWTLPAWAIALAYIVLIGRPRSLQLAEIEAQLKPSVSQTGKSSDGRSTEQQLSQASTLEKQLLAEFSTLQSQGQQLTTQSKRSSDEPVERLAETLQCFSSQGLKCLQSEPVVEAESEQVKSTAPTPQATRVRLRVSGTFQQMRQALRELQAAPSCTTVQSLSMEPCASGDDANHLWTLIILV